MLHLAVCLSSNVKVHGSAPKLAKISAVRKANCLTAVISLGQWEFVSMSSCVLCITVLFSHVLFLFQYLQQAIMVTEFRKPSCSLLDALNTNLRLLFNALNEISTASLLKRLLELSKTEGGLWSLTLKSVMTDSIKNEFISHVLADFILCEECDYSEQKLQTLQCLIGAESSIYNLKIVVEKYSKMLSDIDAINVTGRR